MATNKFAKWSILPAILTIIVSMMLSIDFDVIILYIGYVLGLIALGIAIKGIMDYANDKTIKGLGFAIASILLTLWALLSMFLKFGFNL